MTPTQKIIALAELEGWRLVDDCKTGRKPGMSDAFYAWYGNTEIPPYLTSHDALQPLLEKMTEEEWDKFGDIAVEAFDNVSIPTFAQLYLKMTPEQKADTILKACGKWEEE